MNTYSAYGLGIHSSLPLPELSPLAEVESDVVIQRGELDKPPPESESRNPYGSFTANEAYLSWDGLGAFRVRNGNEIIFDPSPEADERLIRLPLLGTVLGILLHQRGFLVLHASAIAIDKNAVIFIGWKGAGKSTTAAALYARGHDLISDDIVAIDMRDPHCPMVMSGSPQIKLWPEAASALGHDLRRLPHLASGYDKRSQQVRDRFSHEHLPLKAVFALSKGTIPALKLFEHQHALRQLIAHSYVARFGRQLLQGEQAALHLFQCTSILRNVPVYSLERPGSLSLLAASAQLVENHLGCCAPIA